MRSKNSFSCTLLLLGAKCCQEGNKTFPCVNLLVAATINSSNHPFYFHWYHFSSHFPYSSLGYCRLSFSLSNPPFPVHPPIPKGTCLTHHEDISPPFRQQERLCGQLQPTSSVSSPPLAPTNLVVQTHQTDRWK